MLGPQRADPGWRSRWLWWVVLTTIGSVVIALPDTDARLFSFSEGHGPSALDAVGIIALLGGWIYLVLGVWSGRRLLMTRRLPLLAGLGLMTVGVVLLVWSISGDHGTWWILGVFLLAAPQLSAAAFISLHS